MVSAIQAFVSHTPTLLEVSQKKMHVSGTLNGCRHIDVSSQRGNEAQIGAALLEVFSDWIVHRPDVWVTGKVWHNGTACPSPTQVRCQVSNMLAALKVDYFDLCLLPAHNNMKAFKVGHKQQPRCPCNFLDGDHAVPQLAKEMQATMRSFCECKGAFTPACIVLSYVLAPMMINDTSGLQCHLKGEWGGMGQECSWEGSCTL